MNTSSRLTGRLSQNSANCLLTNGLKCLLLPLLSLHKSSPYLLARAWFVVRYFSFVEQIVLVIFADYFSVNVTPSLQSSFPYALRWLASNTSSMISSLIFLNKSFLHLDVDSASEWIHPMQLFVNF